MKRTFLLVMSAMALIAVLALSTFGWERSCKTVWSGGTWHGCGSSAVVATTSPGYLFVTAPYSGHNCGGRESYTKHAGDNYVMANALCPPGSPDGTIECCAKVQWNLTTGQSYFVTADQSAAPYEDCGPTVGTITGTNHNCSQTSPEP